MRNSRAGNTFPTLCCSVESNSRVPASRSTGRGPRGLVHAPSFLFGPAKNSIPSNRTLTASEFRSFFDTGPNPIIPSTHPAFAIHHPQHSSFPARSPPTKPFTHPNRRLRHLFSHFILFRVDAAWPRDSDGRFGLRRFRAKPTPPRLALTALSLTPCHPPSASVLSLSPFRLVSSRCRSSEERNKPETAEREKT
jgi:hypothetical protein